MPNFPESTICPKCGKPLDLKTALEIEEKDKERVTGLEQKIQDMSKISNEIQK